MQLFINEDQSLLDKLRYETGYNPFSPKFNPGKNKALYESAKKIKASQATINIIQSGGYFHDRFFKPLLDELNATRKRIPLQSQDLLEFFVAHLNKEELLNRAARNKHLDSLKQVNAFDLQQSTVTKENMPDNPQNFARLSEAIVDFANIVIRWLPHSEPVSIDTVSPNDTDEVVFDELTNMVKLANKFHNLQAHYNSCLFFDGDIEIGNPDQIYFDACTNDFWLSEQIAITIIENQRLNRFHYFKHHSGYASMAKDMVLRDASVRILSTAILENGFAKYSLRKRTQEDYKVNLDYLVSVLDYYPFYSSKKLIKLNGLTITQVLNIHSELVNLVTDLYFRYVPENKTYNIRGFIIDFLPRIKHSVLKGYLVATTKCTESQIEMFLSMVTIDFFANPDLFSSCLIKRDNYYFFPYFSLSHPNYLHLIDYWLEQAGESLDHRGKAFEDYIREELASVHQEKNNIFRVIGKKTFRIQTGQEEEIDLLIETKSTLIIAEIKCIKYPMEAREYYSIFSEIIQKAALQLKRKKELLLKHYKDFQNDFSLEGKTIIPVIILNYPFFASCQFEGIPIIDSNFFLAYFKSGYMVERSFDNNGMQEHNKSFYYTNEVEFCNNFYNYLINHPMVEVLHHNFQKITSFYRLEGMPAISFTNIIATKQSMIEAGL